KSQHARLYRFDAAGRAFGQPSDLGGWMGGAGDGRRPTVRTDRGSFERSLGSFTATGASCAPRGAPGRDIVAAAADQRTRAEPAGAVWRRCGFWGERKK